MTLVSDIITQALRECNTIASAATPTTPEQSEALSRLQTIVSAALGSDVGYQLEDWGVTHTAVTKPSGIPVALAGFTVRPNSRLVCNLGSATSLDLDPMPQDGQRFGVVDAGLTFAASALTLDGNGRKLEGAVSALVLTTSGLAREWLYRADIADWVRISGLATDSEMPLPVDFDDFFVISLAARLSQRYGKALPEVTVARLAEQRAQINARYAQTRLRPAEGGSE